MLAPQRGAHEKSGNLRNIQFVGDHFVKGGDPAHGMVVLRILLNALAAINCDILKRDPTIPLLYESGVVYQREAPGVEEWQDIVETLRRGFGDCEDLACWRVAELREREGVQATPDFTLRNVEVSPGEFTKVFHIFVRLPGGLREDPSRMLGMTSHG